MNLIVTFNLVTFLNFILLGKKTTIQSKTKKGKVYYNTENKYKTQYK